VRAGTPGLSYRTCKPYRIYNSRCGNIKKPHKRMLVTPTYPRNIWTYSALRKSDKLVVVSPISPTTFPHRFSIFENQAKTAAVVFFNFAKIQRPSPQKGTAGPRPRLLGVKGNQSHPTLDCGGSPGRAASFWTHAQAQAMRSRWDRYERAHRHACQTQAKGWLHVERKR